MLHDHKALIHYLYDEVHNRGNLAVCDELMTPNYTSHTEFMGHQDPPGPASLKRVILMLRDAFPDLHNTIEDMVAEGDRVSFRVISRGTHTGGSFFGHPPTGRAFHQEQVHIIRFADGKMVEHWAARDDLGMMLQLGIIALPTAA